MTHNNYRSRYSEEEESIKANRVIVDHRFVNYLNITNVGLYSTIGNDQYNYPDGFFSFQLSKSITPKYFKLESLVIPNTWYQHANNRKEDTSIKLNKYIKQNAPLKVVWRETNDAGTTFDTFERDLPPGNYTLTELLTTINLLMDTGTNGNLYNVSYNDITMRASITRTAGTYDYAMWFETYQQNDDYYNIDIEQMVSEYIGWGVIPLVDDFTTGIFQTKTSPLIADASMDLIILMEIVGTPAILQQSNESSNVEGSFNCTFVCKQTGNRGDFSTFVLNSDYQNLVYFTSKTTFSNMLITLKNFQTGVVMHFNGSSPYILFSYEQWNLNESFIN